MKGPSPSRVRREADAGNECPKDWDCSSLNRLALEVESMAMPYVYLWGLTNNPLRSVAGQK